MTREIDSVHMESTGDVHIVTTCNGGYHKRVVPIEDIVQHIETNYPEAYSKYMTVDVLDMYPEDIRDTNVFNREFLTDDPEYVISIALKMVGLR